MSWQLDNSKLCCQIRYTILLIRHLTTARSWVVKNGSIVTLLWQKLEYLWLFVIVCDSCILIFKVYNYSWHSISLFIYCNFKISVQTIYRASAKWSRTRISKQLKITFSRNLSTIIKFFCVLSDIFKIILFSKKIT